MWVNLYTNYTTFAGIQQLDTVNMTCEDQIREASKLQTQPSAASPRSGGGLFDDPLAGAKKTQAGDIGNSTVVVLK